MQILSINCGSSSLRFKLMKTGKDFTTLAEGHVDGIGLPTCKFKFKSGKKNIGHKLKIKNHKEAIKLAFTKLPKEIDAIGHRVVHGGKKYSAPTKITPKIIKDIEKLEKLAPLHNKANLEGIIACKELLPRTPQFAIFDTAFHQTMPEKAFRYAIPKEFYAKHDIRRYGFHGTNHKYVINETIKKIGKKNLKIVSCHLGNGASITASINGKSIDTSMGFTPLEGLIMGTRAGSIDPAIPLHLATHLKMKPEKIDYILNHESGLKALSEISSDMRDIYAASLKKDPKALLTIEILAYQIAKYIGAYAAAMNGLDAVVFTGTLGEKAHYVRKQALAYTTHLKKFKTLIIHADEEKQIAIETWKSLKNGKI